VLGNGCRYTGCFVLGTAVAMNRVKIGEWFSRHDSAFGWVCLTLGLWIWWAPWPHFHDEIVGIGAALLTQRILNYSAWRTARSGAPWTPATWRKQPRNRCRLPPRHP
jgi:hypothetical protein